MRAIVPARYVDGVLGFVREDLELAGPLTGHVHAIGPVGDGTVEQLRGGGFLVLHDGATLLDQHLTGEATLVLDDQRFSIAPLTGTLAKGALALTAHVARDGGALDGTLVVKGAELAGIDELAGTSRPFTGTFDVDTMLTQSTHNPGLVGRAQLHHALWGRIPIGDADVALAHDARNLTLQGALLSGRAEGTIHVVTRTPFAYNAALVLRPGSLVPLLPAQLLPDDVDVRTHGNVEVHGALKTFRDSRGALVLHDVQVDARGLALRARSDVLGHFHGARLNFEQLDLGDGDGDTLSVRGLLSDDAVDLQLEAAVDVAVAHRLVPRITEAQGHARVDLTLTGDLDHVDMNGRGVLSDGVFVVDGLDRPLRDVRAQLGFRGADVVVESLHARLEDAPIDIQGIVTLEGLHPKSVDMDARFSKLRLRVPESVTTRSSGHLTLKGDASLPVLKGDVVVHEAHYGEDINWERLLPDLRRRGGALADPGNDEDHVRLGVHVSADRGLTVEDNVLDVEAKGDVVVGGTDARPVVTGSVQLLRGTASFRGNRYRLTRGSVDFVDTSRTTPILDVEAETRVQDYDVTARVSGPARDPRIDLASNPSLNDIDIVSLLTFGFTQYDVRDPRGSAGAAGLEVVSAYTGLDEEVRRILPAAVRNSHLVALDELKLTSQFSLRAGASFA